MRIEVLLLLIGTINTTVVQNITGTLNGDIPFQQLTYPIPSSNSIVSLFFKITYPDYSNTLVYFSFTPINLSLSAQTLSNLIAKGDPLLSYMDELNTVGNYAQVFNLYIPNSATNVYLGLYNLDLPEVIVTKNYNFMLQFSSNVKVCYTCPYFAQLTGGLSCQCSPCPSNTIGDACQYSITPLQGTLTFAVNSGQSKYYSVSGGGSFQLSLQENGNTSGTTLYVQYNYTNSLPGKINCIYNNGQPLKTTVSSTLTTITVPPSSLNVLLSFRNAAALSTTITVSVLSPPQSQSSIVPIILGVTLGIVGALLLILIICKVRKYIVARNTSVLNISAAAMADSSTLVDQQINKYFPAVFAALIRPPNSTENVLNLNDASVNQMRESEALTECSICFDEVNSGDLVRVTYCRHIFHAKCLLQWFHKNQICPNCRHPYDYQTTKKMRSALPKKAKATPQTLVSAILGYSSRPHTLEPIQPKREPLVERLDETEKKMEQEVVEVVQIERRLDDEATENRIE